MLRILNQFIREVTALHNSGALRTFDANHKLAFNPEYYDRDGSGWWSGIFQELRNDIDTGKDSTLKYLGETKEPVRIYTREYAGKIVLSDGAEASVSYMACDMQGDPADHVMLVTDCLCYFIQSGSDRPTILDRRSCVWADGVIGKCA